MEFIRDPRCATCRRARRWLIGDGFVPALFREDEWSARLP